MLNDLSRAMAALILSAGLTACAGDDVGDTDTDSATSNTTATTGTTTASTTDSTTDDSTTDDSTTTSDETTTSESTTDTTDSTTTGTDTDTTDGTATDTTTDTTDGTTTSDTDTDTDTDGTTDGTTTDGALSFEADIYPSIIGASCSCHIPDPKAGLHMPDAMTAYDNLVGVAAVQAGGLQRVNPGMPGESYLINKLEGTHLDVGGVGNPMPPGGPLSADKVTLIKDWIAEGAMP
jgi:hypothetical protein